MASDLSWTWYLRPYGQFTYISLEVTQINAPEIPATDGVQGTTTSNRLPVKIYSIFYYIKLYFDFTKQFVLIVTKNDLKREEENIMSII